MRIGVLGFLVKDINKNTPGGTEIFTYHLCEELVRRGHEVTLFATAKSKTSAKLVSVFDVNKKNVHMAYSYEIVQMVEAAKRAKDFDIIHNNLFNTEYALPLSALIGTPVVSTIHNDFVRYEVQKNIFKYFDKAYYIFISKDSYRFTEGIANRKLIYNGIDTEEFTYNEKAKDYYFWIGRIADNKGVEEAITVAKKLKEKLIIAGPPGTYFKNNIKPLIGGKIIYFGVPSPKEKIKLYQGAKALFFPSKKNEGCPLVPLEAQACGTPVITLNHGPNKELLLNGKTGFVVRDVAGMVSAARNIKKINRIDCRKFIEKKFSLKRMVDNYEEYYNFVINDFRKKFR